MLKMKDLILEGRKIQETFKKNVDENINEVTPIAKDMQFIKKLADVIWTKWKTKLPSDFDYPGYGGLPKPIAYKLTSDFVDAMQDEVGELNMDKSYFSKVFRNQKSVEDMVVRAYKRYGSII
jgi:hypothetical protein